MCKLFVSLLFIGTGFPLLLFVATLIDGIYKVLTGKCKDLKTFMKDNW